MVIITDTESLITDLQTLLRHPHTTPTITVSNTRLPLPPQLLSSRNAYFRALLSAPWSRPDATKPNASADAFRDLLEFLVTGCVALSSRPSAIPHILNLAFLANETLATELEDVVVAHVANHLSCHSFRDYLNSLHSPLRSVEILLADFLKANPRLLHNLPHSPHTAVKLCQLLSTTHLPPNVYPDLARYIASSTTIATLRHSPHLKHYILTFPAPTFVRHFERLGIFTHAQLLEKYRHEACSAPPRPASRPKTRLLYESPHPHERCARFEQTVTLVTLPVPTHARLDFHERSALAEGAVLAFFIEDPALGAPPCKFLVGKADASFVIPSHRFWFAFSCADDVGGDFVCAWGWRFFVEPCAPVVDDIGLSDP